VAKYDLSSALSSSNDSNTNSSGLKLQMALSRARTFSTVKGSSGTFPARTFSISDEDEISPAPKIFSSPPSRIRPNSVLNQARRLMFSRCSSPARRNGPANIS